MLQSRGSQIELNCCFCADTESCDHLFFQCSYTAHVWRNVLQMQGFNRSPRSWQQEISWLRRISKFPERKKCEPSFSVRNTLFTQIKTLAPLQSMKLLLLLLLLPSPYALYFTFKSLPRHFRSNINMAYFWILVTFLMVFLLAIKGSKRSASKKLPPGPWKLPLVGNLHQIAAAGSLPHHALRNMAKKYGPLMHLQLGEVSSIIVTSPEIAKEIFITNGVIFAQRPHIIAPSIMTYNSRDIALAPYGSYWRQLRKICTLELLTAKRVQSFQSIRNDEVSVLVNDLASNEGSLINLSEKIFSLTYAITSRAAFGAKSKQQDAYISIVKEVGEMSAGFSIADIYPSIKMLPVITGMKQKLEKLLQRSDRTFQAILDEHREGKHQGQAGEDLITCLLKLQENGDLEFPLTFCL